MLILEAVEKLKKFYSSLAYVKDLKVESTFSTTHDVEVRVEYVYISMTNRRMTFIVTADLTNKTIRNYNATAGDYEPFENYELEFFDKLGFELAPEQNEYDQDISDWWDE